MVSLRSGALVIAVIVCAGCAERQAQRAVQTAMVGLAHAIDSTDAIVDPLFEQSAMAARNQAVEERNENREITISMGMDRYRELMAPWYAIMEALVLARRLVVIGQSTLDVWISTNQLPPSWMDFCGRVGSAFFNLLELVNAVEVDVPDEVEGIVPHIDTMCKISVAFISDGLE